MLFSLEYTKEGIARLDIDGKNVLRKTVSLTELPDVLRFLHTLDGVALDKIDAFEILRRLGDGAGPKISTEGKYDPNTKKFLIDVELNGLKVASDVPGEQVARIVNTIDGLWNLRKSSPRIANLSEVLDFPRGKQMTITVESMPELPPKRKMLKKISVEVERVLLDRKKKSLDEIVKDVSRLDNVKKVTKTCQEGEMAELVTRAMGGLNLVKDDTGKFSLEEPEKPLRYEERAIDILRVMYKVDPDKTKREGWKMRELKTQTKMDINALNKVVRYMKFQNKIQIVGGLGRVNNAFRYAPTDFNYDHFREEYETFKGGNGHV